jgi:hypothetical protein
LLEDHQPSHQHQQYQCLNNYVPPYTIKGKKVANLFHSYYLTVLLLWNMLIIILIIDAGLLGFFTMQYFVCHHLQSRCEKEEWSSEMLVYSQNTTWHNNPEDHNLYSHFSENLKSYIIVTTFQNIKEQDILNNCFVWLWNIVLLWGKNINYKWYLRFPWSWVWNWLSSTM